LNRAPGGCVVTDVRRLLRRTRYGAVVLVLGLCVSLATACAESGETLEVVQPPSGAELVLPFEVMIETSAELGSPADGLHHVHIWFGDDITSYLVVESTTVEVVTAPIGEHELHVSLRNPDHTSAGVDVSVPVVIRPSG